MIYAYNFIQIFKKKKKKEVLIKAQGGWDIRMNSQLIQIWSRRSPAVVVAPQTSFPVGVLERVVRVLEGLIPEETGFAPMQAGLVLEASVVLPVGGVTLWTDGY